MTDARADIEQLERLPAFQVLKARIAERLRALSEIAARLDLRIEQAAGASLAEELLCAVITRTADDLDAMAFNVAVIGEFNRGKSTLINAILNRADLLSTAPLPNTAAITRLAAVRPGEAEHYRVTYRDPLRLPIEGADLRDIERFTSDRQKAGGFRAQAAPDARSLAEEIERVELFIDSEFLRRNGIVLIDTPGLGAVTRAHQEVTEQVIPTVHAALFVFMVDPPIGAVEIAFLQFSLAYVSRFLFVMNDKQDALSANPLEAADVMAYAERELAAIGIASPVVIGLNPRAYLKDGSASGGFDQFLPRLTDFLIEGRGRALLDDAIRKAGRHTFAIRERVDQRLADLDRQTDELLAELVRVQQKAADLQARKQALIAVVDAEMQDIVALVSTDVDNLSVRIEQNVFAAIDGYGIGALREAHLYLPDVIKATVSTWMQDKSAFVNARFNRLYRNVIADLRELLAEYDSSVELDSAVHTNLSVKLGMEGIRLGGDVAMAVAAGLAIAAGIVLANLLVTGGIGALITMVAGAAGSGTAGAVLMQRVRGSLKAELGKRLAPPNEAQTMLSAVIEGYTDEGGQAVKGIRALIDEEFRTISEAVKGTIAITIHNAWAPRLEEIEAELRRRDAAGADLTTRRTLLQAEAARLKQIELQLAQAAAEVSRL